MNAEQLYKTLKNSEIFEAKGRIKFKFLDVSVIINTTDIVGHVLQAWLKQWMIDNDIYFEEPSNTQAFPDFYLSEKSLLEIKAFNYNASSPAFDIANFESYCDSLTTDAYRLDADYLIFGYTMEEGIIKIKEIWLKKIWEISSSSRKSPLKVQKKRGMIYNIRPTKWYSHSSHKPFKTKEQFVLALYETLKQYEKTSINPDKWLKKIKNNYELHSGQSLDI